MASVTLITSLFFVLAVLSAHAQNDGPQMPDPDGHPDGHPDPRPFPYDDNDRSGPSSLHPVDVDAPLPGDSLADESEDSSNVEVDSSSGGDELPPLDVQPAGRPSRNRQ